MRDRILKYLNYGNRFCAIEHTINHGQERINVTLLRQSKKELVIDDAFYCDSLDAIEKKLPKHQHFHLVLNNEKVLVKTIESEQHDALKLVYKAFPNIHLEEFYYEVLSQANHHYIALCRRDYVEEIIDKYRLLNRSVINVSLGNILVSGISNFINQDAIYSSNAKIKFENNKIVQMVKTDTISETYDINGLAITNQQLLSFSGALQSVLGEGNTQTNFSERLIKLKDDYKHTRFFNLFLKFAGLFTLGLLLVNFLVFNHYFNKVGELRQLSEVNQSTKNQILKLDEVVSKKQKMVDDLLKSSGSKSSYYANAVIQSLPNSILLSSFNYQPLLKRIKREKDIELKEGALIIEGASNNSEEFSSWISTLEHEEWITNVAILDYGSKSSKKSDFKIEINLKDD